MESDTGRGRSPKPGQEHDHSRTGANAGDGGARGELVGVRRHLLVITLAVAAIVQLPAPLQAGVVEDHLGPGEPQREFESGFVPFLPVDKQAHTTLVQWNDPHVGGWGGVLEGDEPCTPDRSRRPVVFVHGTTEDAWFWRAAPNSATANVRNEFIKGGWCPSQLWAISYTGAKGYFTYNDINADEVAEFILAVRRYTSAPKVDVVAHSLGVTVVRKAALVHRELYKRVGRFVAIAGANHGTTTCRGVGTANGSEVCIEIEPGSAWLDELNYDGETPRGPEYLTMYDPVGDHFFVGPDARSPRLDGACNHEMPGEFHNGMGRGPRPVAVYRDFLGGGVLPECHS